MTMDAQKVYKALEEEFRPWECTEVFDTIGLQYHNTDEIKKVFTACFASAEVLDQLERRGETDCLLFAHHRCRAKHRLCTEPYGCACAYQAYQSEER